LSVPVSVIVPVLNEELNIRTALAGLQWADEIWVVDSHSQDRTAEIAMECGAKVVQFDYPGYGPKKLNWALEHLRPRNRWILLLAADERVPQPLQREIASAVVSDDAEGYYIDMDYVFLGRSLRCKRPNWNLRLLKHVLAHYEWLASETQNTGDVEVHEQMIVSGRTRYLHSPVLHDDRRSLKAWIDNHNRYSEWEARVYRAFRQEPIDIAGLFSRDDVWRKRSAKRIWVRLPLRPLARFLLFYVARKGFLDGRQGFRYSVLMGYYEFMISTKLFENRVSVASQNDAAEALAAEGRR
jgi:glycosyltransferase involved in cell wall biosynthesis